MYTENLIFHILLILTRIAGILMFFPGFSEKYILTRANLVIALFSSLLLVNVINQLPPTPESPLVLALYIIMEMMIGVIIGLSAKIIFLSVHITGAIMSMQSGMSASQVFDPAQGGQVPIMTNILSIFCLISIFLTDTHHLLFLAMADSYNTFIPGEFINTPELTEFITLIVAKSFTLGVKLSAPFIIVNMVMTAGNGLLARLMPSFQVFFVMTPAQIMILFAMLLIAMNPILETVITNIQESILMKI